jgi:DNA-binding LytR/AlgR family response regulator
MIKIVIVEDELVAVKRLTDMLALISMTFQIVKIIDSVEESISFFSENHDFDIILMDVHLADGNSFDIFKQITIKKPIIFTTAYSEFAIDAFKQYAVDYLLKPIRKEQLELALEKYKNIFRKELPDYTQLTEKPSNDKRWMIKIGQNLRMVDFADVAYYFTKEKISYLMTFEGKKFVLDITLEGIELQISDQNYFRINRQFIIHRNAIDSMSTHTKSRVRIKLKPLGEDVVVSTERSPIFKKWLLI